MKFVRPVRLPSLAGTANQKVVVSAVFVAAMFMNIMDGTVVNVALPMLSRYFAVPIGSVSGVVTAYLVTLAVAMPASGWIGDRFGGRNVLLAAITVFTAASALCGLATSLPELVAFRALQGLGGGTLIPVGMTMITRTFPPAERIKANQVLIVPTLLLTILPFVWAMNQAGWQTASQVLFWIGPILLYILLPALDLRFGADDHILRHYAYSSTFRGLPYTDTLTVTNLRVGLPLPDSLFTIALPAGYVYDTVRPGKPVELLTTGVSAPDWTLTGLDGRPISLAKLRGRVVVIDFWYLACPPCLAAMPTLSALQRKFDTSKVMIVGINVSDSLAYAKRFLAAKKFAYSFAFDGAPAARDFGWAPRVFKPRF